MKRLPVVVFTVLLAAQSAYGTVQIEGETKVPQNKMVRLSVKTTGSQQADWDVQPDPGDMEILPDGRLLFTGPPGDYLVKVSVIDFDKKTFDRARVKVTILGGGPTPPTPPGPQPAPSDALWPPLLAAYTSDTTTANKADCAARLAVVFRNSAKVTCYDQTIVTNIALYNRVGTDCAAACPLPNLLTTRQVIAGEFDRVLGTNGQFVLTPDFRNTVAAQFNRVAGLLERLPR